MTTLARALQPRNHDVVFMALPDAKPSVRAANLAFVPSCEFPAGSFNKMVYQLSKRQGEYALYFTLLCIAAIADDRLVPVVAPNQVGHIYLSSWRSVESNGSRRSRYRVAAVQLSQG
jgi:hypothetical protein